MAGVTRAAQNVAPQLEELRTCAVRHIREYLVNHINSLRAKGDVQVRMRVRVYVCASVCICARA